jgi:hypothetical protein
MGTKLPLSAQVHHVTLHRSPGVDVVSVVIALALDPYPDEKLFAKYLDELLDQERAERAHQAVEEEVDEEPAKRRT